MVCQICQRHIKEGHKFVPYVPEKYFKVGMNPGIMHASHLSEEDFYDGSIPKAIMPRLSFNYEVSATI